MRGEETGPRARIAKWKQAIGHGRILAVASAVLLVWAGCSEDPDDVCRPEVPGGRIEGTVRVGHHPVDGTVRATRVPAPGQSEAEIDAIPDPGSGDYALDVPAGRYILAFAPNDNWSHAYEYSASGLRYGDLAPDTVLVDDPYSPFVADFNLATLRANLGLSTRLDGEYAYLNLHLKGKPEPEPWSGYLREASGEIENGEAEIILSGILPGEYKVEVVIGKRYYLCDCPWDGEHFWIPGVRDSTQSPWIEARTNRLVDVNAAIDPVPARIEGEVLGAWLASGGCGSPAVELVAPDSTLIMGARDVGDDGRFGIDIYLPEPLKILVVQEGIRQWVGGESFEDAEVFQLERGQTTSGARFVQSGLRLEISGVSVGLGNIRVSLYGSEDFSLAARWSPPSSPPGDLLSICNLRPGSYLMRLEPESRFAPEWLAQWYNRAAVREAAQTIVIDQEGEVVTLPVVLDRGGRIAGQIRGPQDSTDDFFIYLIRADDPAVWAYDFASGQMPEFAFQGLTDGDWKVGAWRQPSVHRYPDVPPPDTIWYPGTTDWEAAQSIEIRGASEVTGIEIPVASP